MTVDLEMARLLSGRRDTLCRPEQEEIFARIARPLAPAPRLRRWPWAVGLAAAAAAAAIILLQLAAPASSTDDDGFVVRSGSPASFAVYCAGDLARDRCAAGDRLLFDTTGAGDHRYFAAFGHTATGTVIWYFPASDREHSVRLAEHTERGVLDLAIVLGPEHAPGPLTIYGILSHAPLSRHQIRALVRSGADHPDRPVIVRRLEIE